jgi:hypothetical protein
MPAKWIEHKGKKVLYVDVRKASSQEFVAALREGDALARASPSKILYLGNIEDAATSREVMKEIRQIADRMGRKMLIKLAVVGVTGVKKILMDAVVGMFDKSGVPVRAFKTEQDALDWLVE